MKVRIGAFILVIMTFAWSVPVWGCTLWAATGEIVTGGGSIIAKNRDWKPNHSQEVRLVSPREGFRFFGLYAVGGDAPGLKAGVNERDLVVVSASASSLSDEERSLGEEIGGSMVRLLANCASVDEALCRIEIFKKPQFLMLADRHKIAYVETAPNGRTALRVQERGIFYHTNHYLDNSLLVANHRIGKSSLLRLERVKELVESSGELAMDDFIRISADQNSGPDNSLWRTGGKPGAARTLSTWIIALPPEGGSVIYVKLANPGETVRVLQLASRKVFASQGQ